MRVSRQTQAENRAAMLDQAARLFRARGIEAVGVAEVTRAAGLTHGAFYGHFPSKSALAADVCRGSLQAAATRWQRRVERARAEGRDPALALIDAYLTEAHRDAPAGGCALAALGGETVRDPDLRAAMAEGTTALTGVLAEALTGRAADPAWTAAAILATLVGGLLLARTFADNPDLSANALEAARAAAHRLAT